MNDTQRILDILEANGTPLSRRDLLRLAGESGIALASLALVAGARPEPAAAQARRHDAHRHVDRHPAAGSPPGHRLERLLPVGVDVLRPDRAGPRLPAGARPRPVLDPARPEDVRVPAAEGRPVPQRAGDEGRRRQVLPRADPGPRRAKQVVHADPRSGQGRGASTTTGCGSSSSSRRRRSWPTSPSRRSWPRRTSTRSASSRSAPGPSASSSACRTRTCSSGAGRSSTCPASPRWTRSGGCR